ncbi:MAG: hypothetical protein HY335_10860 [Deinococcus sp.]|nr:hypothetical protein [Deinococcus sp.]
MLGLSLGQQVAVAQGGQVIEVKMIGDSVGFRFEPAGIVVQPGDTIRWVLESGPPHTATAYAGDLPAVGDPRRIPDGAPGFDSGLLVNLGDAFEYAIPADAPLGTYDYYCLPHILLGMKGTVIVGQPGGPGSEINEEEPTRSRQGIQGGRG